MTCRYQQSMRKGSVARIDQNHRHRASIHWRHLIFSPTGYQIIALSRKIVLRWLLFTISSLWDGTCISRHSDIRQLKVPRACFHMSRDTWEKDQNIDTSNRQINSFNVTYHSPIYRFVAEQEKRSTQSVPENDWQVLISRNPYAPVALHEDESCEERMWPLLTLISCRGVCVLWSSYRLFSLHFAFVVPSILYARAHPLFEKRNQGHLWKQQLTPALYAQNGIHVLLSSR